jgi:hypothetical protein
MSAYPIGFEVDYVEPRNRLTTFFRFVLAIPHLLVLGLWAIAAYVVVIIAWFALLVTGRWPQGMYDFTAQFVRYLGRVYGYAFLLTDTYPPFSGGDEPAYPIRVPIAPALGEYNRLKVLLRIFYVIPAFVIQYVLLIVAEVVAVLSWFAILFTGKQPRGFQNLIDMGFAYATRSLGLMMLVTETYPPITNDQEQISGGSGLPEVPAGASM